MDIIRFALIGMATGSLYAMVAQGLVLVYRGTGLVNLAQGAFVMVGAYAYYEVHVRHGITAVVALPSALIICAILGALTYILILRPMRTSSSLSRTIATLGILIILQSAAILRYEHDLRSVPSLLPTRAVRVLPSINIGLDRILIFAMGVVLTVLLWWAYRQTSFGRITTAVAEDEFVAASLGHSPYQIAVINWSIGSALAGLAGVLIAPITFLEPSQLILLIFPALAAGLVGQFSSFPLAFAGALTVGIAQSEIQRYVSAPGWTTAAPFILIILLLVVRGRGLPLRSTVLDRLPAVSSGRVSPVLLAVFYVIGLVAIYQADTNWSNAISATMCGAIICLSVVVITGYAGQLSLAQYVLAGVAAFAAAKLAQHMAFVPALLLATIITVLVGGALGLPALRVRGITLAIVTFGIADALFSLVLNNSDYVPSTSGIEVPPPDLFGWSLDPFFHDRRYAGVVLTVFVLLAVGIANLRRGAVGRRLLAVRSNERAAAASGIGVSTMKSYAFMLAAWIAAVGGVFLAFLQSSILPNNFDVLTSITIVAVTVVGGVASVGGSFAGALLLTSGVVSQIFNGWESINSYLALIGGVMLLITLRFAPDGSFPLTAQSLRRLTRRLPAIRLRVRRRAAATATNIGARPVIEPRALAVSGLSVSFGGVHALKDVAITILPGEVHGLMGPNGAGKTTLIDAITGFVGIQSGEIVFGDKPINRWSVPHRARSGLSRSFQSLELFTDLSVEENLAVASEKPPAWRYFADMIAPRRLRLTAAAYECLQRFELVERAHDRVDLMPLGVRKTIAIARAVAGAPSVLLLDEPAAGLDNHEADELAGLIRTLAAEWGIGVLLVEHRIDMILSISDRVTVLDSGAILASGTPDEIRASPEVRAAYFGSAEGTAFADDANNTVTDDHVATTVADRHAVSPGSSRPVA